MKRVVALLWFVVACQRGPSQDQCKQLLDHLVDLEFKKAGAGASNDALKAEIAKSKVAVSEAKSAEFMDICQNKTTKSRVDCALAASDLDGENGVGKCDDSK